MVVTVSARKRGAGRKIAVNKNLRAVAVHPANPNIVFPLEYVSFEPKLGVYKNGEKKLHLYFSFKKKDVPVYFEQTFSSSCFGISYD